MSILQGVLIVLFIVALQEDPLLSYLVFRVGGSLALIAALILFGNVFPVPIISVFVTVVLVTLAMRHRHTLSALRRRLRGPRQPQQPQPSVPQAVFPALHIRPRLMPPAPRRRTQHTLWTNVCWIGIGLLAAACFVVIMHTRISY